MLHESNRHVNDIHYKLPHTEWVIACELFLPREYFELAWSFWHTAPCYVFYEVWPMLMYV